MDKFETWWEREGQEFLFALNTTTDDDIKLVAEVAWKNGAYCAEQAEQEPVAWRAKDANGKWMYGDLPAPELPFDQPKQLYAAPVRTKDLTYGEKFVLIKTYETKKYKWTAMDFIDAVIAADRSKNRG